MPIAIVCPGCGAKAHAPDAAAGKTVKCPRCQVALLIPAPAIKASTSPPVALTAQAPGVPISPASPDHNIPSIVVAGSVLLALAIGGVVFFATSDFSDKSNKRSQTAADRSSGAKNEKSNASAAGVICLSIIGVLIVVATIMAVVEAQRIARMSPAERAAYEAGKLDKKLSKQWGPLNPVVVCPHCQAKGSVRMMPVKRKKGISGGKAAGAWLTGGWSLLVTGLSREEGCTQAHCMNCNVTWDI